MFSWDYRMVTLARKELKVILQQRNTTTYAEPKIMKKQKSILKNRSQFFCRLFVKGANSESDSDRLVEEITVKRVSV